MKSKHVSPANKLQLSVGFRMNTNQSAQGNSILSSQSIADLQYQRLLNNKVTSLMHSSKDSVRMIQHQLDAEENDDGEERGNVNNLEFWQEERKVHNMQSQNNKVTESLKNILKNEYKSRNIQIQKQNYFERSPVVKSKMLNQIMAGRASANGAPAQKPHSPSTSLEKKGFFDRLRPQNVGYQITEELRQQHTNQKVINDVVYNNLQRKLKSQPDLLEAPVRVQLQNRIQKSLQSFKVNNQLQRVQPNTVQFDVIYKKLVEDQRVQSLGFDLTEDVRKFERESSQHEMVDQILIEKYALISRLIRERKAVIEQQRVAENELVRRVQQHAQNIQLINQKFQQLSSSGAAEGGGLVRSVSFKTKISQSHRHIEKREEKMIELYGQQCKKDIAKQEQHILRLRGQLATRKTQVDEAEAELAKLKQQRAELRVYMKDFFKMLVKQMENSTISGVQVIKSLLKVQDDVDLDHLPSYLEYECKQYMWEMGTLEFELDDLRERKARLLPTVDAQQRRLSQPQPPRSRLTKGISSSLYQDLENVNLSQKLLDVRSALRSPHDSPLREDGAHSPSFFLRLEPSDPETQSEELKQLRLTNARITELETKRESLREREIARLYESFYEKAANTHRAKDSQEKLEAKYQSMLNACFGFKQGQELMQRFRLKAHEQLVVNNKLSAQDLQRKIAIRSKDEQDNSTANTRNHSLHLELLRHQSHSLVSPAPAEQSADMFEQFVLPLQTSPQAQGGGAATTMTSSQLILSEQDIFSPKVQQQRSFQQFRLKNFSHIQSPQCKTPLSSIHQQPAYRSPKDTGTATRGSRSNNIFAPDEAPRFPQSPKIFH